MQKSCRELPSPKVKSLTHKKSIFIGALPTLKDSFQEFYIVRIKLWVIIHVANKMITFLDE